MYSTIVMLSERDSVSSAWFLGGVAVSEHGSNSRVSFMLLYVRTSVSKLMAFMAKWII